MILARSSDGNVRVRDVIRSYAVEGEDGVSELCMDESNHSTSSKPTTLAEPLKTSALSGMLLEPP